MSTNTIDDLREMLMDTMRDLKAGKMEVERAKAISDTAQVVINSAKVEVEYARATGQSGSRFLQAPAAAALPDGDIVEPIPGGRKITHKLRG